MTVGTVGMLLFTIGAGIVLYRVWGWNAVAVLLIGAGLLLMFAQYDQNSR